jgi:hypothetical protein
MFGCFLALDVFLDLVIVSLLEKILSIGAWMCRRTPYCEGNPKLNRMKRAIGFCLPRPAKFGVERKMHTGSWLPGARIGEEDGS